MITNLVIFGASGDLMTRYLAPALAALERAGRLPEGLTVVGSARREWDTGAFRDHVAAGLDAHAGDVEPRTRRRFLGRLRYTRTDVTDPRSVAAAVGQAEGATAAYLALPPTLFPPVVGMLAEAGLPPGSRVALEKPFGHDLGSARELNRLLHDCFPEEAIFRIDFFLSMQAVRHLLTLRFANRVFEPLWSADEVERIDVVWDETLALEGRAGYYDGTGALRDVLQNHLLELLAIVAMDAPETFEEQDLRDRRVELLRAVRPLAPEEVAERTVRARYTAGRIGDRTVPAYVDEDGVEPESGTETFAQVELAIDNRRWAGVPVTLRTGKALGADRREIVVTFRQPPGLPVPGPDIPPALRLRLEPDEVALDLNLDRAGEDPELAPARLRHAPPPPALPAYAHTLAGILKGDLTLAVRDDEAEVAWEIVQPILDVWEAGGVPLRDYAAGSPGPTGPPASGPPTR